MPVSRRVDGGDIMKTVDFCGIKTGRLAVGGNPWNGFSYIEGRVTRDDMLDYYTAENVLRDLHHAESLGYTAYVATTDHFMCRVIRQYRSQGGKMQWFAQTHVPLDMRVCVNQAIEYGAAAIFQQGTQGDSYFEEGRLDLLKRNQEEMRRAKVPVGLATHVPEFITAAEAECPVDFYMACLHNMRCNNTKRVSSSVSGMKNEAHEFRRQDREEMLSTIRAVGKPCIAYKILGGGGYAFDRAGLKQCFEETYAAIKPGDIATVGVFQRDHDQLKENIEILADVLGE
jgi:hypothetical protein